MVRLNLFVSSSLIAAVAVLICLVAAQDLQPQPPQPILPVLSQQSQILNLNANAPVPATCVATTTKPTPAVEKLNFKSCIVMQFASFLDLGQGKYLEIKNPTVIQDANATSKCDNSTALPPVDPKLVIDFECGSLAFDISHTNDSKTFVKAINGHYNLVNATNVTFSNSTPSFFTTLSGHYYKCNAEQTIQLGKPNLTLVLSNFAFEAYRTASGTDFYQIQEECPLDSEPVSDLVRIGVGVCLVALVAIVLIAYFIGRRRWSERSSYESV